MELGWSARPDTDAALRETVDWYVDNQDWWRPLIGR
jgi:dTDP-glucose 4,6-dehydratase